MTNEHDKTLEGYLEQQLLIAMPSMLDPNFARSVTLMCQHTEEGAIGITINRVSDYSLGEIFTQLFRFWRVGRSIPTVVSSCTPRWRALNPA